MATRYPTLVDETTGIKIQKAQKKNLNDFAKLNFADSSEVIERKLYKKQLNAALEIDYLTLLAIKNENKLLLGNEIIGEVLLLPIDLELRTLHADIVFASKIYGLGIASYVIYLLLQFLRSLGYRKVITKPQNNEISNILKRMDFKTFDLNSLKLNQIRSDIRPCIVDLLLTSKNLEIIL